MKNLISGFKLLEISGDLFTASGGDSLVHCVSADFHLGRGIAVDFKSRYPGIKTLVGTKVGEVGVYKLPKYFIYNLVTKSFFYEKPEYEILRKCLQSMASHAKFHSVNRISMPRIGCGLDNLNWNIVKSMLVDAFSDSDIIISVYALL